MSRQTLRRDWEALTSGERPMDVGRVVAHLGRLLAVADAAAALVGEVAPRDAIGDCDYCSSRYPGDGHDFTPHEETCVWWLAWKALFALEALS